MVTNTKQEEVYTAWDQTKPKGQSQQDPKRRYLRELAPSYRGGHPVHAHNHFGRKFPSFVFS